MHALIVMSCIIIVLKLNRHQTFYTQTINYKKQNLICRTNTNYNQINYLPVHAKPKLFIKVRSNANILINGINIELFYSFSLDDKTEPNQSLQNTLRVPNVATPEILQFLHFCKG